MSDVAAHLVDDVFPPVPARQWVCSLPWRLRVAIEYERALTRSLRHRAKAQPRLARVEDAPVGAVTFEQRCDSSLPLNVHVHTLALDGVWMDVDERGWQARWGL